MDGVGRHHQILVGEFGGIAGVGKNAADLCSAEYNHFRLLLREELRHGALITEIQLVPRSGDQLCGTAKGLWISLQAPDNRRPDHAVVTGDKDFHNSSLVTMIFMVESPEDGLGICVPLADLDFLFGLRIFVVLADLLFGRVLTVAVLIGVVVAVAFAVAGVVTVGTAAVVDTVDHDT